MKLVRLRGVLAGGTLLFVSASVSHAQLADQTQITPNVAGGQIGKS